MVRRVMEVGGLVRRCRRGVALGLLAWAAGAAGEGTGQIELVDGSVLKGRFLEMTPERGVVWGHDGRWRHARSRANHGHPAMCPTGHADQNPGL